MSDHDAPATDADVAPADPEELDFTDDESVVEIGKGRYVVGTNGRPNVKRAQTSGQSADETGFTAADPASPAERQPPGANPHADTAGASVAGQGAPGQGRPERSPAGTGATVDRQAVSRWLASSFDDDGFAYGIDATLHADGETSRQRMVSNDVTATFDSLVTWFASNAGPNSPTPEALGLLLVASETTVSVPPVAIKRFAASQGLTASDSIGDLVRAAEEAGGFQIE
jgi:hypothetical protein